MKIRRNAKLYEKGSHFQLHMTVRVKFGKLATLHFAARHIGHKNVVIRATVCFNLQFFVFTWRHHFPNLQISNPTGVLESSDIRPYQNLVFYDV